MIKILHTGDIHLDSPFSGLDARHSSQRRNELRAAFTSMMTYAKMTGADIMLIAGDLFDGDMVTRETVAMLCREFETFGKPVFIAPGNHDPASPKSIWTKNPFPENVHVFTEEKLTSVDLDELGVTVYGFGFASAALDHVPTDGHTVSDPARINLLVCHGDMTDAQSSDCPVTASHLLAFGADYTALGHIHNPPAPGPDNRWCYCGCLEARGFDECGPKGACLVELAKQNQQTNITIKRVRFSKRRYEKGELILSGAQTAEEISEAIGAYIREKRYGDDTLLSLSLTGTVSPALLPDTEQLENDTHGLYLLKLTDRTRPELDFSSLETDRTVRGELYRQLKPSLESTDERTREVGIRALRYAFAALSGEHAF
ncbi:MAG: DNA repair exonuclease [Clostridia bacterium]|nr:DNA repair exonuclease [Clostridia bacterium]